MSLVDVKNLNVSYSKGKKTVSNCSFTVNKGEVFGLLGFNGAGKSTVIKVLTGITKTYGGTVKIFGKNARYYGGEISSDISYIPQYPCMYTDFTVQENLGFFADMNGIGFEKNEKQVELLINQFHLQDHRNTVAGKLSGGYKQLLNIALSVILDRPLIIFDEPTANLDHWSKRLVSNYIKMLKKQGKTVILTTHDLMDAQELCDHLVILSDGKVLAQGEMNSLINRLGGGYRLKVVLTNPVSLSSAKFKHSKVLALRGNILHFECAPGKIGDAVNELTTKLKSKGAKISNIDVHEPSLSRVFFNLALKGSK